MIKVFGVPRRIICDHGRSFTSEEFREFCDHIQTKIHFSAVATPRGNGQVERYNRTVLDSLATMGADLDDDCWDENIHNVQLGLNGTLNRAVGVSPSEALMGFQGAYWNLKIEPLWM
jgi:transposase InsO family protein